MRPLRAFEYGDPGLHVEFSRTELMRDRYGCAMCRHQVRALANKCKPYKRRKYCGEFELERAGNDRLRG